MVKISLCMIVKDEEEVLARCLKSAQGADEMIIVDTGSTDKTIRIAEEFGAKVYPFPWRDDFSAARNFAFSKATGDYLLWLDADDVLPEELSAIRPLLEREMPDMVTCPYDVAFDEAGNPTFTFFRERFLKRVADFRFEGRVHECIVPRGKVVHSSFRVRHLRSKKDRNDRNLRIYERQIADGEPLSPRDILYYGRELYYHAQYEKAAEKFCELLESDGWYVNKIEGCKLLAECRSALGDGDGAREALLTSFRFGEPRGAVCYALGRAGRSAQESIFWHEAALLCLDHSIDGDFEEPLFRGLYPLLELTRLYYAEGDVRKSVERHLRAVALSPTHPSVVHNDGFFKSKGLI